MEVGLFLLRAMCAEEDASLFYRAKLTEDLFLGTEKELFSIVQNHLLNYKQLPSLDTLEMAFPDLPEITEPAKFYLDKLNERHKYRHLNSLLHDCASLLKEKQIDEALKLIATTASELQTFSLREQIVEFSQDAADLVFEEVKKKSSGADPGILFGWPYLDAMVNGLRGGDVVSYVGRPAAGKTWQMLYSAHNVWAKQEKNVLFVSMEMDPLAITQRLASLHTGVSISEIKTNQFATKPISSLELLISELNEAKSHPSKLFLVDGNLSATPQEIFSLCSFLNPDVVFIDGAYLLRSEDLSLGRFVRVAENIEAVKKLTSKAGVPTVCSYQFNRTAAKKKTSTEVGLDDIGYSDAIGQISSIVLGLFEEDTVETLKSRSVRVMKGREGAIGQFSINWDFLGMDFREVASVSKSGANPIDFI